MTDYDREPERPVRETERTTIIHDTADRGGGGGGMVAVLLVILVLLAILFFLSRGSFMGTAPDRSVHVNVAAPNVKGPHTNVKVPEVKVSLPKVDVKTEESSGNKAAGK